jgi:hypothetical protein
MSDRIHTYAEFWPFYLREHSKPVTRWLHYVGTSVGSMIGLFAAMQGRPLLVPAALVAAYGMAWIGHFGFEKNRPASFKYPLWSLISDYRMLGLMVVGQLGPHLERAKAVSPAEGGSGVRPASST